ncbi:MAG: NAD-dependent epimerase/dehydratase family protein [bacterium]|nr:NAD-dependent epimerase/dehydratase family protein [bacterium]
MKCLVTGGAGFIGSHTVDALLARGDTVRILDNLQKPVHQKGKPAYLPAAAEFVEGDVRDRATLRACLAGVDAVFHLAAYQDYLPDFHTFFDVNVTATALLYELIVADKLPIKKVVVASSQAVAGEGLYRAGDGRTFCPNTRAIEQLERGTWEIGDADGCAAVAVPTPETVANPWNAYGMSKLAEEMVAIRLGQRYGIPSVAMRYSIVQGPRQSFYNAYSGACRIFCLSLYFDKAPVVYEDGQQLRDYVNIHDVVAANLRVLDDPRAEYHVYNVGGGRGYTVSEFAEIVRRVFDKQITPSMPGKFRFGDTRHIVSDISALQALGWAPRHTPEESVREYLEYLRHQTDIEDILAYAQKMMQSLNVVRDARK